MVLLYAQSGLSLWPNQTTSTMRLSKAQIEAIASEFIAPFKMARRKEEKDREKAHMEKWLKTPDGKLYAKLPAWMKNEIGSYSIEWQASWKDLEEKKPLPTTPDFSAVVSHITIAAIDAKSVGDITKSIAKAFK